MLKDRDGIIYRTIKIGNLEWFLDNYQNTSIKHHYPDNNPENRSKFGCLYNWRTAMKAAPEGWRLPTRNEIKDLTNLVDITNNVLPNAGIYDYSLKHTCIFQQGTAFWTSETYTHRNAYSWFINNDLKYMLCTSMNDCLSVRYVRTI
ncbi:MAG: hypothetical protein MJZ34_02230 [Paludibacteraceae bacterium]|nr:hypothetical protein [Paludibacteraceae bacterium]